jgi:hypothetical protein
MPSESNESSLAQLPRRANAAVIDMSAIGLLCFGVQGALQLSDPPRRTAGAICMAALGVLVLIEMVTGWTIGKQLAGLSVRTPSGRRPPLYALVVRALPREFPVAVFLPSVFAQNGLISLLIWGISLTLVCCYIVTTYLLLVRIQKSPFDLIALTAVVAAPKD